MKWWLIAFSVFFTCITIAEVAARWQQVEMTKIGYHYQKDGDMWVKP